MAQNKWEFKAHNYQIADTGDYDGYYEITNGDITLITKDDFDETERQLKLAVVILNRWGIKFRDLKSEQLEIDIHCMKDAQRWKDEEFTTLRARADKMEQALKEIAESDCDYENVNFRSLHSTECRSCRAKQLLESLAGDLLNPDLLNVMQDAEKTKEEDLRKVKEDLPAESVTYMPGKKIVYHEGLPKKDK